jgi:hypothetical protein
MTCKTGKEHQMPGWHGRERFGAWFAGYINDDEFDQDVRLEIGKKPPDFSAGKCHGVCCTNRGINDP